MTDLHNLLQETIQRHIDPHARVVEIQEHDGEQGYSGAKLRYYHVTYQVGDTLAQTQLVTKAAPLHERRTLTALGQQRVAVPFSHTFDLTTDAPALICMEYAGDKPPRTERAPLAAKALAGIHAANMGHANALNWLPPADPKFATEWLIEGCWRTPWQKALAGQEYTDAGDGFAEEFQKYTAPMEKVAARFLADMTEWWNESTSLTLVHADFHDEQFHVHANKGYVIDWDFAHYGLLYIDLPNYFTRERSLLYRDALADLGYDIPPAEFLARYDAVRPYVGFKYFLIGLWNWRSGAPIQRREQIHYWIRLVLHQITVLHQTTVLNEQTGA